MSNESEDAIRKAEHLLSESDSDQRYLVVLPKKAVEEIYGWLHLQVVFDISIAGSDSTTFDKEGLPLNHPERLLPELTARFEKARGTRPNPENLSIPINMREVDLINSKLKYEKVDLSFLGENSKQDPTNTSPDLTPSIFIEFLKKFADIEGFNDRFFRNRALEINTNITGAFIELNLAFIRAGGKPRPEFTAFYDGPLPIPSQGNSEHPK
jgi:hypothetical protein